MTDAAQAVVWDAVYEPFGTAASITGSASLNLRFPGQYFLIESGLAYNWHRHYDSTIGRYTQPDPLGLEAMLSNGPSVYAYAAGNPVSRSDLTGEQWGPVIVGIGVTGIIYFRWLLYNMSFPPLPPPPPPSPEPKNSCTPGHPFGVPGAEVRNWTPIPPRPYVAIERPEGPPRLWSK
jgi:RHS repeat-associated protein